MQGGTVWVTTIFATGRNANVAEEMGEEGMVREFTDLMEEIFGVVGLGGSLIER